MCVCVFWSDTLTLVLDKAQCAVFQGPTGLRVVSVLQKVPLGQERTEPVNQDYLYVQLKD